MVMKDCNKKSFNLRLAHLHRCRRRVHHRQQRRAEPRARGALVLAQVLEPQLRALQPPPRNHLGRAREHSGARLRQKRPQLGRLALKTRNMVLRALPPVPQAHPPLPLLCELDLPPAQGRARLEFLQNSRKIHHTELWECGMRVVLHSARRRGRGTVYSPSRQGGRFRLGVAVLYVFCFFYLFRCNFCCFPVDGLVLLFFAKPLFLNTFSGNTRPCSCPCSTTPLQKHS